MKSLLLAVLTSTALLLGCSQADHYSETNAAVQSDPDALTDDQIADLEKQAMQIEDEINELSKSYQHYSSAVSWMLAVEEELPDLDGDGEGDDDGDGDVDDGTTPKSDTTDPGTSKDASNGKSPEKGSVRDSCSKQCQIIKKLIVAINSGDAKSAKKLIKALAREMKIHKADCEKKLKKCRDKIAKAKACRDKNKHPDQGKCSGHDKCYDHDKGSDRDECSADCKDSDSDDCWDKDICSGNGKGSDDGESSDDSTDNPSQNQNPGSGSDSGKGKY